MRPVLQPHLYELHNSLHPAPTSTSTAVTTAGVTKSEHSKSSVSQHNSLNLDIDSHEALHEHIYHAYGDWDNSYDTTKLMLAGHKFNGSLGTELLGAPPPLMTSNPFLQDPADMMANGGMDGSSQASSSKILQFGSGSTACSLGISSNSGSISTTAVGNGISSSCSVAAAFTSSSVPPAPGVTSLLNPSLVNHHGAKDHVHTDACFKNMKALPISSTGTVLFNSNQSAHRALKSGGLLASAAAASSSGQASAFTASSMGLAGGNSASSLPSLATGISLPLGDQCLKHNQFLHMHHSSFSGTHTTDTISTSSGLPTHAPPMKLTSELIRSVARKEGTTSQPSVTSQPISSQSFPLPSATRSSPHTCAHMHGASGGMKGIHQLPGQHNPHGGLLDPKSQVWT